MNNINRCVNTISKLSSNKVALITGSSKGIGKSIALRFARSKEYSALVINARKLKE